MRAGEKGGIVDVLRKKLRKCLKYSIVMGSHAIWAVVVPHRATVCQTSDPSFSYDNMHNAVVETVGIHASECWLRRTQISFISTNRNCRNWAALIRRTKSLSVKKALTLYFVFYQFYLHFQREHRTPLENLDGGYLHVHVLKQPDRGPVRRPGVTLAHLEQV